MKNYGITITKPSENDQCYVCFKEKAKYLIHFKPAGAGGMDVRLCCKCIKEFDKAIDDTMLNATVEEEGYNKKSEIIKANGVYHYFDKEGNELHEGDMVITYQGGKPKELYRTTDGTLGFDATNPVWLEKGYAAPCEYGIYPLDKSDMEDIVKVTV